MPKTSVMHAAVSIQYQLVTDTGLQLILPS